MDYVIDRESTVFFFLNIKNILLDTYFRNDMQH